VAPEEMIEQETRLFGPGVGCPTGMSIARARIYRHVETISMISIGRFKCIVKP